MFSGAVDAILNNEFNEKLYKKFKATHCLQAAGTLERGIGWIIAVFI